jgi:hypothetical protein
MQQKAERARDSSPEPLNIEPTVTCQGDFLADCAMHLSGSYLTARAIFR